MALSLVLAMAFGLTACKKKEPKLTNDTSVSGTKKGPSWVTKCAGAFPDAGKDAFYGCGSMPMVENLQLQQVSAESRVRKDLALAIDSNVSKFFSEYMDSAAVKEQTRQTGMTGPELTEFVAGITREVTIDALSQEKIAGRWRSPRDGTLFVLSKVSSDDVAASMAAHLRERARQIGLPPDQAVTELALQLVQKRWK